MHTSAYPARTALAVVIANMIGTGVFTSLGFQLQDIDSGFVIIMLWLVGGVTALCGAMCYAELGAALPRSGGEYHFLTRIYHPAAGFVSGWISVTVGFAAPTALAAVTFGAYLSAVFPRLSETGLAITLIVVLALTHASNRRNSGAFQMLFTTLKLALIVVFCVLTLVLTDNPQPIRFTPVSGDLSLLASGGFAVSLIYVSYAYSGWNAATYLSSELAHPQRSLPWVLALGTALVTLLYLALNMAFLYAAPVAALRGEVEIGYIAAQHVFGTRGANIMGVSLGLLLISTVSAMQLAAPRVLQVIGQDYRVFRFLSRTNRAGVPALAIYLQAGLALLFVITGTFEKILIFAVFVLALNTFFTVLGVIVLRYRQPQLERPYRAWGYPVTPLVFLALTLWTLVFVTLRNPLQSALGLGVIGAGFLVYLLTRQGEQATS